MNNANNATRLGIYFFMILLLITGNSSAKAGNYDSCDAENSIDHCLKCNANLHRILKINETCKLLFLLSWLIDISYLLAVLNELLYNNLLKI